MTLTENAYRYNSVVFNTLNANAWRYYAVTEDFFALAPSPLSVTAPVLGVDYCLESPIFNVPENELDWASDHLQDYHDRTDSYKNASILECLQRFNNPFVYRPNVFLVRKQQSRRKGLCWIHKSIPNPDWTLIGSGVRTLDVTYPSASFDPGTLCARTSHDPAENKTAYCGLLGSGLFSEELAAEFVLDEPPMKVDYCIYDDSVRAANESQRQCRLQCSPVLLLGSYKISRSLTHVSSTVPNAHVSTR